MIYFPIGDLLKGFFFFCSDASLMQTLTHVVFANGISSELLLFSSYTLDKFNYYYHFTIKRFAKWCEGKQARPHGEKVAAPLHMEPSECVQALMRVCLRVSVWGQTDAGCDVYKLSQLVSHCPHRPNGCPNTHILKTHIKDNECNWQGYYCVSCAFTIPLSSLLFDLFSLCVKNIMRTS